MPIYEFYCDRCNTIFSFLSRSVHSKKRPDCPLCGQKRIQKQVSMFAATGRGTEDSAVPNGGDGPPLDEARMERAVAALAGQVEKVNENDPRQAAALMRRFSDMAGLKYGKGMEEALQRMEGGEDPEKVEAEMGDVIEKEDPFAVPGQGGGVARRGRRQAPRRDSKLYEL